jgi:hypothetical protein
MAAPTDGVSFIVAGTAGYYGLKIELQNVDQRVVKIENALQ